MGPAVTRPIMIVTGTVMIVIAIIATSFAISLSDVFSVIVFVAFVIVSNPIAVLVMVSVTTIVVIIVTCRLWLVGRFPRWFPRWSVRLSGWLAGWLSW